MPKFLLAITMVFFIAEIGLAGPKSNRVNWLLSQQVPNAIVPNPADGREGLMVSYVVPNHDAAYPYLYSRSFIYDNAVAVIAFTMKGQYEAAENILTAMSRLIDSEGKIGFSHNTHDHYSHPSYRTGAIAWVGYAYTFYINHAKNTDPDKIDMFTEDAQKIGDWVLTMLVTQANGGQSVKGGPHVSWFSTEHNIDAYFFLRDLGELTNNPAYSDAANEIKISLLANHYNHEYGAFQQGIGDSVRTLDVASWGSLFLRSIGEEEKADSSLAFIESDQVIMSEGEEMTGSFAQRITCNVEGKDRRIQGYKPWVDLVEYHEGEENFSWADAQLVWSEGSLGVAMAYSRAGESKQAKRILRNMRKMSGTDKGVLYSCTPPGVEQPTDFSSWKSVAGTGWWVMVKSKKAERFWSAD